MNGIYAMDIVNCPLHATQKFNEIPIDFHISTVQGQYQPIKQKAF